MLVFQREELFAKNPLIAIVVVHELSISNDTADLAPDFALQTVVLEVSQQFFSTFKGLPGVVGVGLAQTAPNLLVIAPFVMGFVLFKRKFIGADLAGEDKFVE